MTTAVRRSLRPERVVTGLVLTDADTCICCRLPADGGVLDWGIWGQRSSPMCEWCLELWDAWGWLVG